MYWYIVHEWGEAMGEVLDVEDIGRTLNLNIAFVFVGRIDLWSVYHPSQVP